ncbi:hypothetical protein NK6_1828 [Bradyrhizobium diazoefficiens]|jgi:hypothetical protein|uniref:Uncharacterized protein n=1 Tax=Bradyrhizobium diazoefficiens TaxID=1355477 RepID=A0A0E4FRJ3_9BRAD|nr:hypothetical protein NK6_1828 [Bradyrhizobium diazoefficiens]
MDAPDLYAAPAGIACVAALILSAWIPIGGR